MWATNLTGTIHPRAYHFAKQVWATAVSIPATSREAYAPCGRCRSRRGVWPWTVAWRVHRPNHCRRCPRSPTSRSAALQHRVGCKKRRMWSFHHLIIFSQVRQSKCYRRDPKSNLTSWILFHRIHNKEWHSGLEFLQCVIRTLQSWKAKASKFPIVTLTMSRREWTRVWLITHFLKALSLVSKRGSGLENVCMCTFIMG